MNEKEKEAAKQSLVERTMKLHDEIADLGNMPFTTESRRAYQAGLEQGFDAGYNAHSGWVRVHEQLPDAGEDKLWRQTPHDTPMVGYLDNERERVYRVGGSSYEDVYTFQYWTDVPPFTE